MKILISGGTGLIGRQLLDYFKEENIYVLTRGNSSKSDNIKFVNWNPSNNEWWNYIEKPDIIINLAGKSIGEGRWNKKVKEELISSRIKATSALVRYANENGVTRLFSASAVGFYGNRGNEILIEDSAHGNDFLSKLALDWETEAKKFEGTLTIFRFGMVIGRNAQLLHNVMKAINLRSGKKFGSGKQWHSWVDLREIPEIIKFIINKNVYGTFNVVSPQPVQNENFLNFLASVSGKKQYFGLPAFALRIILGEMADYLVLSSQKALPKKLEEEGYSFKYPDLMESLQNAL